MKRIIARIRTAAVLSLLCLLSAGSAWAAVKPIAVWNGDFPTSSSGTSTRGGFTLEMNGNSSLNGNIQMSSSANKGVGVYKYDNGALAVANTPFAAVYNISNITTSGSRMFGTTSVKNGTSTTHNRTMAGLSGTTFTAWHSGGSSYSSDYQTQETFTGNDTTIYSVGFVYRPDATYGTDLYLDGACVIQANGCKWSADENNIYGVTLAGSGGTETRWSFPSAVISYVALLKSSDTSDISAWSLNKMTSAATFTDGSTITTETDYSSAGINLNGGAITVSGEITAAAIFVQADTTLNMVAGTSKLISNGPVYIADGVTLTINVTENPSSYTAGTASSADLITGTLYVEDSTVAAGTLAAVSGGRANVTTDTTNNKISWVYTPMPVWSNGSWSTTPTESDTEVIITVDGSTTFTAGGSFTTIYLQGSGTLDVSTETLTATTIDLVSDVTLNYSSSVSATTISGSGTVVYDGVTPVAVASGWTGTVWIKNLDMDSTGIPVNSYGNANSLIKFTGVSGWIVSGTVCAAPIELVDDGETAALTMYYTTGPSYNNTFSELRGSGTFKTAGTGWPTVNHIIAKWDNFTGTFNVDRGRVVLGTGTISAENWRNIYLCESTSATIYSSATWYAYTGFDVSSGAKLVVNGALSYGAADDSSITSAVRGSGTVMFPAKLPSPTGGKWWTPTNWEGTVSITNLTNFIGSGSGNVLAPNAYGNTGSTLELNGCQGWLPTNYDCTVPLQIAGTLTLNNGSSGTANTFTIEHLKGNGTITGNSSADKVVVRVKEWAGFTGVINLTNKIVVFGSDTLSSTTSELTAGQIIISSDAVVTNLNRTTSWTANGGIVVNGTFAASDRTAWVDGTAVTVNSSGILNFYGSGVNDTGKSCANITGTGTILYTYGTNWTALPSSAANMFASTLSVSNMNSTAGVIVTYNGNSECVTTNRNISGSGSYRSDWGSGTYRTLLALQSKDTEWSGTFWTANSHTLRKFVVAGTGDGGTLTLSGTQVAAASTPLEVESTGSANLTGTWVGATTVSGTFGGTGTLTGNLTFNAGATFKAFASDADGLAVSGTVTCPAEGTVTVDVSALEQTGTKVLMTASGLDVSKFALASGQSGTLSVADGALKVSFVSYVAEYNNVQYETVQEAINAAVQAGDTYADVTILDPTAECPDGYYVDTENSNALTLYQAAIIQNNEGAMTTNYFKTAQLAVDAIEANVITYQYYTHFEVYSGTAVAMTINPAASDGMVWTAFSVKVKCLNSATVAVTLDSTESELTAGDADSNGIVTYTKTDKATTYVWVATAASQWGRNTNWKVGTSEGATATRYPGAADTVIIGNGANVTGVSSPTSVAALQVSGAVTISGGGTLTSASPITLGSGDSITITGTLSPTPTTTVANSYVKLTDSTYSVDAYNTVSFTAPNATVNRTDELGTAIRDGDTIIFTITPDAGYAVTGVTASSGVVTESSGTYSYTVTADATITVTTVSTSITIGSPNVAYYASYTNATVTANVTGEVLDGTTFTLSGTGITGSYTGTYDNGVVTFNNVHGYGLGDTITYTISATGSSSGTLENQSSAVGGGSAVASDAWMKWTESEHAANSSWTTNGVTSAEGPEYIGDEAALNGTNVYSAAWVSTGEVVTVTTSVKFGGEADESLEIDADAQAAVRIGSAGNFQVYEGSTPWTDVFYDGLTPSGDTEYAVIIKLDYTKQKYGVSVANYGALTNATGGAEFALARNASQMQKVSYIGSGSFKSIAGSYISAGYTADIGTTGNATNVVVSSDFVSNYMGDVLASNVSTALSPNAPRSCNNGLNYFESYALGLDPTEEEEKPVVDVTTDENGKFVVTLKKADGTTISPAANVALKVTMKSGSSPDGLNTETEATSGSGSASEFTIDPAAMTGNVMYYKVKVDIGAK